MKCPKLWNGSSIVYTQKQEYQCATVSNALRYTGILRHSKHLIFHGTLELSWLGKGVTDRQSPSKCNNRHWGTKKVIMSAKCRRI